MTALSLARTALRGTTILSTDGLRELRRKDRIWMVPVAAVGILVGAAVILFMTIGVYRTLLALGTATGHTEMVIFYGLLSSWTILFVTGIPLILSLLYYSGDLPMLFSLPIPPRRIVTSKVTLLYLSSLPLHLLLFVPALWLYLGANGPSASSIVSAAVSLLVTPLVPLSLALLFVILLTKVVSVTRHRVALEVAGMTVAIVLLVGVMVILYRSTISAFLAGPSDTVNALSVMYARLARALPPLAWAAEGFVRGSGPVPVLLVTVCAAALGAAGVTLGRLNFVPDVMERHDAGGSGGRVGARRAGALELAEISTESAPRRVVRRLVGREWAILSSSSTFIFETAGELVVLPLVLGIYGLILPREWIDIAMRTVSPLPLLSIGLMGLISLMTTITTVSGTSLSREGARIGLSLTIPVPGRVQVGAKLRLHLLMFCSAYLLDLVIVWVLFRFPLVSLVYMVPEGVALQVLSFAIGVSFDLRRPYLSWTHPQQAMKNNFNAMAGIGCSAAAVVLIIGPFAALTLTGASPFLLGCASAVLAIVLAAVALPRALAYADRQYSGGLEIGG